MIKIDSAYINHTNVQWPILNSWETINDREVLIYFTSKHDSCFIKKKLTREKQIQKCMEIIIEPISLDFTVHLNDAKTQDLSSSPSLLLWSNYDLWIISIIIWNLIILKSVNKILHLQLWQQFLAQRQYHRN